MRQNAGKLKSLPKRQKKASRELNTDDGLIIEDEISGGALTSTDLKENQENEEESEVTFE